MHSYRFLFLAFLMVSPSLLWAQSDKPIGGHFGVKVGASLTRINLSGITSNIPKQSLAPHIGIMYRYRYKRFVVQPELLYAVKGGTFQTVQPGVTNRINTSIRYFYASVPLLLGYIPTEGLTLQAGPEFSYALNAGKFLGPGSNNDLGIVVGAHYDFLDMLNKFSLHVRYVYGLTNVAPTTEPLATYRNRNFQVSMVYNLYKKKR